MITKSVGKGGVNLPADVLAVQTLLARHAAWVSPAAIPVANGICEEDTIAAIKSFQLNGAALATADGVVSARGFTIKRLELQSISAPTHRIFQNTCWGHAGGALTNADFAGAARTLDCELNAIKAVALTETKQSPWDDMGRPTILFERHKFRGHTASAYNASHPDISGPQGAYGLFRVQYTKLKRAAMLNEEAALKSASWGAFQILGENHVASGFTTVAGFVEAMMREEADHLAAFVQFIIANSGMHKALKNKKWATFASLYNGPTYADNDYDTKMQTTYDELQRLQPPIPVPVPSRAQ
jgi:N-acetylmuramidase